MTSIQEYPIEWRPPTPEDHLHWILAWIGAYLHGPGGVPNIPFEYVSAALLEHDLGLENFLDHVAGVVEEVGVGLEGIPRLVKVSKGLIGLPDCLLPGEKLDEAMTRRSEELSGNLREIAGTIERFLGPQAYYNRSFPSNLSILIFTFSIRRVSVDLVVMES